MNIGSKQKDTPGNFNEKDSNNISKAPAFPNLSEANMVGDTRFASKSLSANVITKSPSKPKTTSSYKTKIDAGKEAIKTGRKLKKEGRQQKRQENKANRISNRIEKTRSKGSQSLSSGNVLKARRLKKRETRLKKRNK